MYNVIIGIDEDEAHAKLCAEEVAGMPGEGSEKHVTLIHSFTDSPSSASATQLAPVRAACDVLEAAGIEYEVRESGGDPAESIVDAGDEIDADLIVIGGRKRSPAGKALFGSVTQTVILHAGRPVMVTGVPEDT